MLHHCNPRSRCGTSAAPYLLAQVVSRCISQQVDLLEVLGQLAFSLPEPDDAAYEATATAAVEALLKDMEVAQVRRTAAAVF
jgi:hypothetical protein